MSTNSDIVLVSITEADIEAKRAELRGHEAAIAAIREWLRAAEILASGASKRSIFENRNATVIAEMKASRESLGETGKDLTRAIENIANRSVEPVSKATVRQQLRVEGFEEKRLANYFYTAVMRLKKKGRIQVLEDGRIWRPQ